MLRTLRQPRYAALSALMLLIAIICVAFGTWQIARLKQKHDGNDDLRRNYHQAAAPVASVLPLVGQPAPRTYSVQFRSVVATGTYDEAAQKLVRQRTVNGDTGYWVLTPLRTDAGVLLVVRGFVSATGSEATPVPARPPAGNVTITARAMPRETRGDEFAQLHNGQVESVNPTDAAAWLDAPVFNAFAELDATQPGTQGLVTMPAPDLSNPAGGAVEPQHLAYIIQWYLFAALAVAAPFAMARADARRGEDGGEIDDEIAAATEPTEDELRAARMTDRYGHKR